MDDFPKIVCVDDEENVLKSLERAFLDEDVDLITANGGEAGLEAIEENAPVEIVISDYRMPGMNGVDFLREVYARWPDTVRIVLSGYADTAAIVEAINEGHIYKFIPKPWNDDELRVTIGNALERFALKKRNKELLEELQGKNAELTALNQNLEDLVAARTAELTFQNRVLTRAQNILNALPAGVVGVDLEGMVVQCNELGRELFCNGDGDILGLDRRSALPADLNEFIDGIRDGTRPRTRLNLAGQVLDVHGAFMSNDDGQEGIIVVCNRQYGGEPGSGSGTGEE